MITRLGRRGVEAVISLFAVLGFVYVPLGKHTGWEHLQAVIATPPARELGAELLSAALRLRQKVFDPESWRSLAPGPAAPSSSALVRDPARPGHVAPGS